MHRRTRALVIGVVVASAVTAAGVAVAGSRQPIVPSTTLAWQSFHRSGPSYTYGSDFGSIGLMRPTTITVDQPSIMVVQASFTYRTSRDPSVASLSVVPAGKPPSRGLTAQPDQRPLAAAVQHRSPTVAFRVVMEPGTYKVSLTLNSGFREGGAHGRASDVQLQGQLFPTP